ncbi:MAG: DUF2339 domain-containing protein [Candidatus Limnocylindrales bacterium]
MESDDLRLEALERRVRRLERRLEWLAAPDEEAALAAAAPMRAEAPPAPPPAPPVAAPIASGPTALPGWQGATWWTNPEPAGADPLAAEPGEPREPRPAFVQHPAGPALSLRDLEERFAGRALAWVGGLALVAAAVFFLSLAFSRGWINEPMRVLIGLGVGIAAVTGGAVMLARHNRLMGNVLSAVGLGIVSIALFAATRSYGLVIPEVGLAGALAAAIAAAVIAIRFDAREVAAFGLIAALVAPPVVGASPTTLTLLFVAVTLVGTTTVALFRTWRWLPPLAFILAAPQLAGWLLGDPEPVQAVIALAGFWLVNVVAAAGEEIRIRRDDLRPSSATLVLASATFLLWGGFVVLDGDLAGWRGTYIAVASLAHLLLGARFLVRQGLGHLFGNLVAGTGVALLAIAAFVQLGAAVVPLAWAAEATALAWLAARRRHRWSAVAALALGALVVTHLVILEYPLWEAGLRMTPAFSPPFLHAGAGSLGAVLAAVAVAIALVPVRWVRSALAATGILLAAHAVTFELAGPFLAAALSGLALAGLLLDRLIEYLPVDDGLDPVARRVPGGWLASGASLFAGGLGILLVFATEYPLSGPGEIAGTPFLNPAGASLAVILAGLVSAGALVGVRWTRSALAGTGILLVAWAAGFELTGTSFVALLALLLPVGVILDRGLHRLPEDRRFAWLVPVLWFDLLAGVAGVIAWVSAFLFGLQRYLDPVTWGSVTPPPVPFTDDRTLAAALLAASALAAARWSGIAVARRAGMIAAVAVTALLVPFEVHADSVVALWVALAAVMLAVARLDPGGTRAYLLAGAGLWVSGALVAFGIVAPPDRLWVGDPVYDGRVAMLPAWALSLAAVAAGLLFAARQAALAHWRAWLEVGAGFTAVYLVSVGIVSVFDGLVGGAIEVEELRVQAQVALSVCWTAIGACALVVGLARHLPMLRHGGFALLGIATAKVFVIDLAAMDVAYRALVLAGLGVLLLGSAFLFTHFRGPRPGAAGLGGGPGPAV